MEHKSLFVFSVGPVQSFIAASRKVVDLWSGSYLLSYLIEQGIHKAFKSKEALTVEMIFPNETRESVEKNAKDNEFIEVASYPNRFFCRLSSNGGREEHDQAIENFAQEVHEHIENTFINLCNRSLNYFVGFRGNNYIKEMAEKQIKDSLEVFWAAEYEEGTYEDVRIRTEKMLASAKNNREYDISNQYGLICTVCNQRETLLLEPALESDRYSDLILKTENTWNEVGERKKDDDYVNPYCEYGERLCSICFTKRLAQRNFRDIFGVNNKFRSFKSTANLAKPFNYYGLLLMDGDDMGKWISAVGGRYLEGFSKGEELKPIYHKQISERLTNFSRKVVPNIVKRNRGTLVYSGGDDVLAFAPIDKIFKLAGELREAFGHEHKGLDRKATASMGIIIVHEKHPLQKVLMSLRSLEEKAKSFQKNSKNAFSLGVFSRSGEIREVTLPWSKNYRTTTEYKYGSSHCIPTIINDVARYLSNELSMNFIFKYSQSFLPLLGADVLEQKKINPFKGEKDKQDKTKKLLTSEIYRLVSRSLEKEHAYLAKEIQEKIYSLYDVSSSFIESVHLLEALRFLKLKKNEEKEEAI